jgi:Uma2 family endonuclease
MPMETVDDPRTEQTTPTCRKNRKAGPGRWRWTAEQYRPLDQLGLFEDHHVKLINGELIELTTDPPHDTAVGLTADALRAAFGPEYVIRDEKTLDLGRRYQPHPAVAVVAGIRRDHSTKHPTNAVLFVEVCESSLRYDRAVKAHRYAEAGIADYWIVNPIDRQLEVYRNPEPDSERRGRFHYLM